MIIKKIKISELELLHDRIQVANKSDVTELLKSIKEIGLINPIEVVPQCRVVEGYKRLRCLKILNIPEVEARIYV